MSYYDIIASKFNVILPDNAFLTPMKFDYNTIHSSSNLARNEIFLQKQFWQYANLNF